MMIFFVLRQQQFVIRSFLITQDQGGTQPSANLGRGVDGYSPGSLPHRKIRIYFKKKFDTFDKQIVKSLFF